MKSVLDFVRGLGGIPVSPIGGWPIAFHMGSLDHVDFAVAMGFEAEQATEHVRAVVPGALPSHEALREIMARGEFNYERFNEEIEYLYDCQRRHEGAPAGAGCYGPLTVASDILGAERMLRLVVREPEFVKDLLGYITGFQVEFAQLAERCGSEFYWIPEPVASLLSPDMFWEFCGQYLAQIFDAVKIPGMLHVCGATLPHTRLLEQTGAQLLSIDYLTDLGRCMDMVQPSTVVMGNVSPHVLRYGTPQEVAAETRAVLDAVAGRQNFILSTGCVIMGDTPRENLDVLYAVAREYEEAGWPHVS